MTDSWSVVRYQNEASRWIQNAEYGFWLRHPEGLETRAASRPEGFEAEWAQFRRIGEELHVLELDLTECLNEFKTAYLAPAARIREYGTRSDDLASELRRIAEPPHLDDYADRKADHLLDLLEEVRGFRDRLYGILLDQVAAVVRSSSMETQERLRWLLEWSELWPRG